MRPPTPFLLGFEFPNSQNSFLKLLKVGDGDGDGDSDPSYPPKKRKKEKKVKEKERERNAPLGELLLGH